MRSRLPNSRMVTRQSSKSQTILHSLKRTSTFVKSSTTVKRRKTGASRYSSRTIGRTEFNDLKNIPAWQLPRNIFSALSTKLARRFTTDRRDLHVENGCLFTSKSHESSRSDRPTVNLSNTPLTQENLASRYHFLATKRLTLGHLAEVIKYRYHSEAPSFTYKPSFQPKLAQLAYLLTQPDEISLYRIGIEDVSHLCGNRHCFSPTHLVVESRQENMDREKCFGRKKDDRRKWQDECPHRIPCRLSQRPDRPRPSNGCRNREKHFYIDLPPPPKLIPEEFRCAQARHSTGGVARALADSTNRVGRG
ncbi:uncharacterized protein JCM6883_003254 [Sporobolomyces salmoneus]|uniref:uncharacterized protein n=1 Tax=Sporobolomyces salmoneus TaxID=183962 RepID=UPI00316ECBD6